MFHDEYLLESLQGEREIGSVLCTVFRTCV